MDDERLVFTGKVLPGPTMTAPYVSDVRCVVWAAGERGEAASASGALPFGVLLPDGVEVAVVPEGASAALAVRSGIDVQGVERADGNLEIALGVPGPMAMKKGTRITEWSRVVGWLAVGEEVTVEGRLVGGVPFRGRGSLVADRIRVAGGSLEVGRLAAGEAEPVAD